MMVAVVIVVVTEIEKEMLGMCMRLCLCTYVDEQQKVKRNRTTPSFSLQDHTWSITNITRETMCWSYNTYYTSQSGERDGMGWRRR